MASTKDYNVVHHVNHVVDDFNQASCFNFLGYLDSNFMRFLTIRLYSAIIFYGTKLLDITKYLLNQLNLKVFHSMVLQENVINELVSYTNCGYSYIFKFNKFY